MRSRVAIVASLMAVACGGAAPAAPEPVVPPPVPLTPIVTAPAPTGTPDAPFREHPPVSGSAVAFAPPRIDTWTLPNGVEILLVERHELPLVSVRVVLKVGAGDVTGQRPGVLSFLGAMLEQGTRRRSALEISDAYEAIGAVHAAWVDWDSAGATVKVVTKELPSALDLLSDVVLHPSFPQPEIDRLKSRRLAGLAQEKNDPGAMWSNAAAAALYGRAHPYGHSLLGQEEDVPKISRDEILRAYAATFSPRRAALVVAGDVTREAITEELADTFGKWVAGPAAKLPPPKAPPPAEKDVPRVVIVDRPGAPQSLVRLAEVGVPRTAPDRDAVTLMNTILGGMFASRINLNLREAHAYTYGARSSFQMRHGAGNFSAGGAMVADKTAAAVHELFAEVQAMRDRPVSAEELDGAKENLRLAMPGRFETVTDVTSAVADLFVYDLPLDEYATRSARIDKLTAEDVQNAAKAHLHPAGLKVIVVGDRNGLTEQLEQLHLGAVEARDPYGEIVR